MNRAIYPGSFDPITKGHLDIIERSSRLYDELIIAIMHNPAKKHLFDVQERKQMIEQEVAHLENVKVVIGEGLTVNFAMSLGCHVMVRGIRATSDYEFEMQIATANMYLNKEIETMFMLSRPEYSFVSSSTVKEIASYHGELAAFVSENVKRRLNEKLGEV